VKKRKRTTKKSHECTKGHELIADDGARVKKRKKSTNKSHECTKGHELIAEHLGGEADREPTRELLLHAQVCKNCARLLRSLRPLVLFCLGESDSETPGEPKVLFSAIRRELPKPDPGRRECTEVHVLIAECVCGEPNGGFPPALLRHLLSCPHCDWLMPTLVRVVRTHTLVSPIDMPDSVHQRLRETILRAIHPD